MVGLVGGMKTAFVPVAASLAGHYRVSDTSIAALTAAPLMVSAVTGIISSTVARFWGKRPVYLVAALVLFVGTMWNMAAGDDYGSCLGARILQGVGWGAFDVLVPGTIQDTYFEHERNVPVTIYTVFAITTTWGSPLLGGVASSTANNLFTNQFRIINCLYVLALPLLAFSAPETTFDRSGAAAPTPLLIPGSDAWRRPSSSSSPGYRRQASTTSMREYLCQMNPLSFRAPVTLSALLQAPRALMAPTTCLLLMLTCVPFGALWGLATSISIITSPAPLSLDPSLTGVLMTGPWVAASLCVGGFSLCRGLHERLTQRVRCLILCTGTALVLVGLLSYGLGLDNFMVDPASLPATSAAPHRLFRSAAQVSLPLLSLQLGILAGGSAILDMTARSSTARSASFTSSSTAVAQRGMLDMQSGVIVLRNLAAGGVVLGLPHAVNLHGGLKTAVIALATAQGLFTAAVMAIGWLCDESVWRADGLVMGLVEVRQPEERLGSFFDVD
ncbi:hypothetical protein E4U41_003982 [Claviceps citrina]|nr:hypothetical protein E4U41_003982 [Claviceps citrina]